jgi:hypothetical protein
MGALLCQVYPALQLNQDMPKCRGKRGEGYRSKKVERIRASNHPSGYVCKISFFFLLLFICAYKVWVISTPARFLKLCIT